VSLFQGYWKCWNSELKLAGRDYAVHAQFGQDLHPRDELSRLLNIVPSASLAHVASKTTFNLRARLPAIFLLTFLVSRPKPLLRPLFLQSLLLILCLGSGISLIHVTTTESYLKVMRQAPGLGVLWVWSVVRLDLVWAVVGLLGVGLGVYLRGEGTGVAWWY
jgi:hypothetical protein